MLFVGFLLTLMSGYALGLHVPALMSGACWAPEFAAPSLRHATLPLLSNAEGQEFACCACSLIPAASNASEASKTWQNHKP